MVNIIDQNNKVPLHLHQDSSHRHRRSAGEIKQKWKYWQMVGKTYINTDTVENRVANPSKVITRAVLCPSTALPLHHAPAKLLYDPGLPLPGPVQMNQKQRPGQTSAHPCSQQSRGRSPQVSTDIWMSKSNVLYTGNGRPRNLWKWRQRTLAMTWMNSECSMQSSQLGDRNGECSKRQNAEQWFSGADDVTVSGHRISRKVKE